MYTKRKIISLILTVALVLSFATLSFADESSDSDTASGNTVSATTLENGDRGTNHNCLWAGTVILTNVSGRNLAIEGEVESYHTVDKLGFTLTLHRKATATSEETTVATFSFDKRDASRAYKAFGKTVTQSGYYRVTAVFNTIHSTHGIEGDTASTTWMYVD